MSDHVSEKTIVITGASGGFGRLVAEKAGALDAQIVGADINEDGLQETVDTIVMAGGEAIGVPTDVTDLDAMKALATTAIEKFGKIDVMINNAGVMPLAFFYDHEQANSAWHRCIDINFKGVLNGCIAVYDQMMKQGQGHVINLSSIYGNSPVLGAAVYGATKSAVNFLSESLRVEARGKIKVTVVKPTGVPGTGLGSGVVNQEAVTGIVGQNAPEFFGFLQKMMSGEAEPELLNPQSAGYAMLDPHFIADQVIHVINQPLGVSIGDITIRASGDHYVI